MWVCALDWRLSMWIVDLCALDCHHVGHTVGVCLGLAAQYVDCGQESANGWSWRCSMPRTLPCTIGLCNVVCSLERFYLLYLASHLRRGG